MMTKIPITFAGLENKIGDQAFSVAKCSQTGSPSATGSRVDSAFLVPTQSSLTRSFEINIYKQEKGLRQIFLIIMLWYYHLIMIFNILIFNTFPESTPISLLQMHKKHRKVKSCLTLLNRTTSGHRNPTMAWENSNPVHFVCFLWL